MFPLKGNHLNEQQRNLARNELWTLGIADVTVVSFKPKHSQRRLPGQASTRDLLFPLWQFISGVYIEEHPK